ncbi:hypothetical protein HGO97_009540 [Faecalicatena sp. AGMB00832]|uniref:Sigma-70-like protein n=1 Tax=Faecalicatena faecalis TaxID=2726362 RepID=A0ABS6D3I5_9FIRM|nr:hypothetical protein [Faecalicatena faecalis]MBU3876053.1 hypothetical protein [Faecalicatena faecalis]
MTREDLEHMTDNQLMDLVREENLKAAYDVLVLRYYQDAVRFCMKMIHQKQAALDIVQDSFVISIFRENAS